MARFFLIFGWFLYCLLIASNLTSGASLSTSSVLKNAAVTNRDSNTIDNRHNQVVKSKTLNKRSAAPESNHDDYPDYLLGVKYDEYPMIVPKKRAALLIDRLMVALQKAIENEEGRGISARTKNYSLRSDDAMDLQRRGHQSVSGQKNGRYWRCYFNAVTCF